MNTEVSNAPLAAILRPDSLDNFIGQSHLVGAGKPLRQMIERQQLSSIIFWGPPGVGKTTLARMLAKSADRPFVELSAVSAGKADIRRIVEEAGDSRPVLFLDEIHRFNKAQQDFLLPFVENGTLTLIGATTENPSFEVISALLSRTRVFVLQSLTETELREVAERTVKYLASIGIGVTLNDQAKSWLARTANGDARKLLTIIETTVQATDTLTEEALEAHATAAMLRYDQGGEEHYDTISAFIKSMRASNPDGALYYLARMVAAGEDPQFIARRMVIFASEDIGLAQPTALVVANAVFQAVSVIGYPEAQINLAHGTVYLAQAKKDRRAYDAYFAALADVEKLGNLSVPLKLRNAPTKFMKNQGYGKGYEMYPPKGMSLLPDQLKNRQYLKTEI